MFDQKKTNLNRTKHPRHLNLSVYHPPSSKLRTHNYKDQGTLELQDSKSVASEPPLSWKCTSLEVASVEI